MPIENIPMPDPSVLTTEQLLREIANLKEILEARFKSMDKATELTHEIATRIPEDTRIKISHLKALQDEKFSSIDKQFEERDIRTDQASRAGSEALAAALQAAKELVGAQGEASAAAAVKSETSFTKQIDQIGTIISTLEKALDGRITELKERIDRGEGTTVGARDTRIEYRDNDNNKQSSNGNYIAIAAIVVSVFAVIASLLIRTVGA